MSLKNNALSSRAHSRDLVAKLNGQIAGWKAWPRELRRNVPASTPLSSLRMTTYLRRVRPTDVALPQLAGTCPSLDYPDRERARLLCGWPFRRPLLPPTRSYPDRSRPLRNQGRDCKSRSQRARHRAGRIRRCSGHNREIDSIAERRPRRFAESASARATPFGNANETDSVARRA